MDISTNWWYTHTHILTWHSMFHTVSTQLTPIHQVDLNDEIIHVHTYIYIHTHIHTYIHKYIHTCTYMYTHTHIHTYIHTYIHIYIHTYIHTNGCQFTQTFHCPNMDINKKKIKRNSKCYIRVIEDIIYMY